MKSAHLLLAICAFVFVALSLTLDLGSLVVTYPLTERSRAVIEEELGGAATVIYLADLAPDKRAAALQDGVQLSSVAPSTLPPVSSTR